MCNFPAKLQPDSLSVPSVSPFKISPPRSLLELSNSLVSWHLDSVSLTLSCFCRQLWVPSSSRSLRKQFSVLRSSTVVPRCFTLASFAGLRITLLPFGAQPRMKWSRWNYAATACEIRRAGLLSMMMRMMKKFSLGHTFPQCRKPAEWTGNLQETVHFFSLFFFCIYSLTFHIREAAVGNVHLLWYDGASLSRVLRAFAQHGTLSPRDPGWNEVDETMRPLRAKFEVWNVNWTSVLFYTSVRRLRRATFADWLLH